MHVHGFMWHVPICLSSNLVQFITSHSVSIEFARSQLALVEVTYRRETTVRLTHKIFMIELCLMPYFVQNLCNIDTIMILRNAVDGAKNTGVFGTFRLQLKKRLKN